jgi:enolase
MAEASTAIFGVYAREIIDSRAAPTVEVTVVLQSGYRGVAAIPSGASVGSHEAVELRDKDPARYHGQGVLKAVGNVNQVINSKMKGLDAGNQRLIDQTLLDLDGTENKAKLGANAILGVSLATAVAAAAARQMPLYRYVNGLFQTYMPVTMQRMPTPLFNIINGGKHAGWNLDFQEFHCIPATNKPFHEALRMGIEVYTSLKEILVNRGLSPCVGDEGGFAPNLFTNVDGLEVISEAIRNADYRLNLDIFLGLDLAASNFRKEHGYQIKDRPTPYGTNEFIAYLKELHAKYKLLLMEDAIHEDDWGGWSNLTRELGDQMLIVGDDLLVSNAKRLKQAIDAKACTAVLLKPNQIGSLSELFETVKLAKTHDIRTILSHRSGETTDTFIADLAVGVQSDYVKFGAPARGERVAKYNRLLAIESEAFPKAAQ